MKKQKYRFLHKNTDRIQNIIFSKYFNLIVTFIKKPIFFFRFGFEKLICFLSKNADRFKKLYFSKKINLSPKNTKNRYFSFSLKNADRNKSFNFSEKINLSVKIDKKTSYYFFPIAEKLIHFLLNIARRFKILPFFKT